MSAHVANTNDRSDAAPRLKIELNLDTLNGLPGWSAAPQGTETEIAQAILAAGYEGVQGADVASFSRLGLAASTLARVNTPGEIDKAARRACEAGYECVTLHVAWGFEDDETVDELVRAVIEASTVHTIPLYVEIHRATITQDPWRTLRLVERNPGIRFNGDFSHWYTGLELVYGDLDRKMELIAPVFERVRFMHGRVGNGGHIQVPLADPSMERAMVHYRELWTRSMQGFLRSAGAGDYMIFAPELLESSINYARLYRDEDGRWREDSDRWTESLALVEVAKECFAEAQRRES